MSYSQYFSIDLNFIRDYNRDYTKLQEGPLGPLLRLRVPDKAHPRRQYVKKK